MQLPSNIENTVSVLNSRYKKSNYIIYKLLLVFVFLFAMAMPIVEVDIISKSRGIVRPWENNIQVASIVSGRVKKSNMNNNQTVKKGDTLLVVDPSDLTEQLQANFSVHNDIIERLADLVVLLDSTKSKGNLVTSLYRDEWAEYRSRLEDLNIRVRQCGRELNRAKEGLELGIVSDYDYNKIKDEFVVNRLKIELIKTQQQSEWQKTRQQLEEQRVNIEGSINRMRSELSNYIVVAPISGTIITDIQLQDNSFINSGQIIAMVTPEVDLIVECYVNPTDIGFIEIGQEVALQFDAFNYNQWGLGHAKVYDIDKNVTIQDGEIFFIVRCKLCDTSLSLKNGYVASIRKGMTLSGRFFITKRTLWQLLFDKIDDWLNPKIDND